MEKFNKAITMDSVASKSTDTSTATSSGSITKTVPDLRIRTIKASEYKAAAACLAEAFSTDEVAAYFFECPDTTSWSKKRKWDLHVKILEAMVLVHIRFGVVHAIGDPKDGGTFDSVALWMPPGATIDGWTVVKTGLWLHWMNLRWQLSKEGRSRFFKEFMPLLHETKTEVLKERDVNSWYLVYIGTHSRARGRGLAKRLINEVTREADLHSHACYLESSNQINVPIYRRLGFESIKQIHLHRDRAKVTMDIMVREPVTLQPVVPNKMVAEHGSEIPMEA